ncbi:MAG: histidine--tRNA ligase [Phycisphaerales bacterium]|nr:histidine--tRNA ligase [Phycisphaerales bacterium]
MGGLVEPRLMRGLRDIFPEDMHARQWIIDTIRGVYELYGYVPLGTPALEFYDVLTGSTGAESEKQLFRVQGPEGEELGLRFDQTVALARVVAQYPDLPRPFRRYQVAPVWRSDNPYEKRGRFREFLQFDIDAVGVESEAADVEMITAMCDALRALEPGSFRVRVSSRRVLNLVLPYTGIPSDRSHEVFRVLDKLDKLGPEKVRRELTTGYVDESGSRVQGLGFTDDQVTRLERFLAVRDPARAGVLAQLGALFGDSAEVAAELAPLARIDARLTRLGYDDAIVQYDVSIARGLAYYTGTVFETELLDLPEFGSICSGGRYDDLVTRFLGERVPAVGTSVGVDRLLIALRELGRIPPQHLPKSTAQVLVTVFDQELLDGYLAMTYELRRAGIRTELYLGTQKRIGKQIQYGDRYEVPVLVVYGSDEFTRGEVQLKDMSVGRQRTAQVAARDQWRAERPGQFNVPRAELVPAVRKLLAEIEGQP